MSYKRWAIIASVAGALLVSGCNAPPVNGSNNDTDNAPEAGKPAPSVNTDPKKGWVDLFPGDHRKLQMRCYGKRLIVVRDEIRSGPAVIDNAPECP